MRKRDIYPIRVDYIESRIAHFKAMRNVEAEHALRALARSISMPLDEDAIAIDVRFRIDEYAACKTDMIGKAEG